MFQATENRNPYINTQGTYFQFVQGYPMNPWTLQKRILSFFLSATNPLSYSNIVYDTMGFQKRSG